MPSNTTGAKQLSHRPALTIRELDQLDYLAKLRHWQREDAWKPGGNAIRFRNPDYKRTDFTVIDGNITQAKPLIGRPCFGIPNALLRYAHATRFVKGRGHLPASRCHTCKAKDACRWVVTNRLKSTVAIENAWTAWLQEGGESIFSLPYYKRTHGYRCWTALYRELSRHAFTSVNDLHVATAYSEKDQAARKKDRERKAKERKKARQAGEIDEQDLNLLLAARDRRGRILIDAKTSSDCPKEISRVPGTSLVQMLDVWLGRQILLARRTKPSLGNIARWIVQEQKTNNSATQGALETRVSKDLKRIAKLERVQWQGGFLLPPLDPISEFPSDLST